MGRLRLAAALAVSLVAAGRAHAADAMLRVIVPQAVVRAGPGENYREIHRAERNETFRVVERATLGYWFRVVLPDGTYGWILGDQTQPVTVDLATSGRSRVWERIREALFAPSPILRSRIGLSFGAGALGGNGAFLFRPSVIIDDYFALEAHVGEAVGSDGSLLVYGLDGVIMVWPEGPLVPFLALGGGGATSFPKVNAVTQAAVSQWALDAGGGAMLILRKRIVLRFDFRNYTLFIPDRIANRQEYSGGLAVFF